MCCQMQCEGSKLRTEVIQLVDCLVHPSPDRRTDRQVLTTGPFIPRKEHRAVFDPDPDALLLGERDDRGPHFGKPRPVVIDGLCPVTSDEGVHAIDAECGGSSDHLADVCLRSGGLVRRREPADWDSSRDR